MAVLRFNYDQFAPRVPRPSRRVTSMVTQEDAEPPETVVDAGGVRPPLKPQLGGSLVSGGGKIDTEMSAIQDFTGSAKQKISSSGMFSPEEAEKYKAELDAIAAGEDTGGNWFDWVARNVFEPVNEQVYGALAQGGRLIQSPIKEISDIVDPNEKFSFKEMGQQIIDPNFRLGAWNFAENAVGDLEIMPGKRGEETFFQVAETFKDVGVKSFDIILQTATEALADPTTYFTAGPIKYTGRSGRALLASRLAQGDALSVAPSVESKLGNIYRVGVGALSKPERLALETAGILERGGFRWAGRNIGGEEFAAGLNLGIGGFRSSVGDTRVGRALSEFTTPTSLRPLNDIARGEVTDPKQVLVTLAVYGAGGGARGAGRAFANEMGAEANDLLNDLPSSPFRTTVYDVVENLNDPDVVVKYGAEQVELAQRISGFFNMTKDRANSVLQDFAARRGLQAAGIGSIDDYFFHTLDPRAVSWIARGYSAEKGTTRTAIRELLEQSTTEFTAGAGVTRARKLVAGENFLGTELKTGSLKEINDIFMKVTGKDFGLFDVDAASVVQSYIYNVSKQVQRVGFADDLFRYGEGFIRPVLREVVPNADLVKKAENVVKRWYDMRRTIVRRVAGLTGDVADEATVTAARAAAVLDGRVGATAQATATADFFEDRYNSLAKALEEMFVLREGMEASKRAEFDVMMSPLVARMAELEKAVATGEYEQVLARLMVEGEYARMFPDRPVPSDVTQMAREIYTASGGDVSPKFLNTATLAQAERADVPVQLPDGAATLGRTEKELQAAQRKYNNALDSLEKEITNDPVYKQYEDLQETVNVVGAELDVADAVAVQAQTWVDDVAPVYVAAIDTLLDDVAQRPVKGAGADFVEAWVNKVKTTQEMLGSLDPDLYTPKQAEAIERVLTQLHGNEAQLARLEATRVISERMLEKVESAEVGGKMVDDILEGWDELEGLGVQIPSDVMQTLKQGVEKLRDPAEWNILVRAHFAYMRFMKAYAVSTVGFTTRNALSAAFMNGVAGVSFQSIKDGIKFASTAATAKGGVADALTRVPEAERELYRKAYQMFSAAGGGQIMDDAWAMTAGASSRKWTRMTYDNPYTRTFRDFNSNVELAVRMGMALDSARQGFSVAEGATRIARYHFDYTDLSSLDEYARAIVPFWIFASRNIQLQITSQLTRPALYRAYNRSKELDNGEPDPNDPRYIRVRNPWVIGESEYINWDLPQVAVEEQIDMLRNDPKRLLSIASPLPRSALEALFDKTRFATGVPYGDEPVEAGATDVVARLIDQMIGTDVTRLRTGEAVVSPYAQETAASLLPPIQQIQRLIQPFVTQGDSEKVGLGGAERYRERDKPTTVGSYIGLPYVKVTPSQREGEVRRKQRSQNDLLDMLRRMGYFPTVD